MSYLTHNTLARRIVRSITNGLLSRLGMDRAVEPEKVPRIKRNAKGQRHRSAMCEAMSLGL